MVLKAAIALGFENILMEGGLNGDIKRFLNLCIPINIVV